MSKKVKTRSSSTGTATTTPNVPSFIQGPASDYYSQISSFIGANPNGVITPMSASQTQAFNGAAGLTGHAGIGQGVNATRDLLNFTPDDVQAGQLNGMDMSGYTDPWEDAVVISALDDIERSRAGAISSGQGAATRAGAYGGSRHGVSDSLTNEAALRAAGATAGGLRSRGFQSARNAALADISNRLSADTGNAERGLAGAGLRLTAANQLHNQGVSADANTRANLGLQAGLGGMEREISEQNNPVQARIRYLSQIAQLLGIDPGMFIGQTVNQSGTQTGTQSTSDPWGTLGTILQAAGSIQTSDRRLKRAITPLAADINGTPLYEFEYLWDAPGVKTIGVMADEAPPRAVLTTVDGFLAVDYAAL